MATNQKPQTSEQDFLNSIIHELKNPLNVIIGFSQILRDERDYKISEIERKEYLDDISKSASDLNEIIHDLLDVGRTSFDNFSVNLSNEIDVGDLVKRAVKLNRDYAMRRNIKLESEIAPNLGGIKLDEKRIKQILANLISNSVKYSFENTAIKVVAQNIVEKNQKYLQISVIDQGFGMTQDQIKIAFEKYQTITNPNSGRIDSFGLGLPIVKQLVEAQNGKIEIKSELNKGTEVIIKFPHLMQTSHHHPHNPHKACAAKFG